MTRSEIRNLVQSIERMRSRIQFMVDNDQSLTDLKKEFGIPDVPLQVGVWSRPSLAITTYLEMTERKIREGTPQTMIPSLSKGLRSMTGTPFLKAKLAVE